MVLLTEVEAGTDDATIPVWLRARFASTKVFQNR